MTKLIMVKVIAEFIEKLMAKLIANLESKLIGS